MYHFESSRWRFIVTWNLFDSTHFLLHPREPRWMRERKLRINHVAIAQMPIIIIFSRSTNAHHNGAYQMCAHFSSYNSSVFVVFMIAFFRMKSFFFLHTTPGNEPILLLLFIRLLHTLKYQTNVATLSIGCAVIIQLITNFEFSFAKCQRAEIYNEFVAEKKTCRI